MRTSKQGVASATEPPVVMGQPVIEPLIEPLYEQAVEPVPEVIAQVVDLPQPPVEPYCLEIKVRNSNDVVVIDLRQEDPIFVCPICKQLGEDTALTLDTMQDHFRNHYDEMHMVKIPPVVHTVHTAHKNPAFKHRWNEYDYNYETLGEFGEYSFEKPFQRSTARSSSNSVNYPYERPAFMDNSSSHAGALTDTMPRHIPHADTAPRGSHADTIVSIPTLDGRRRNIDVSKPSTKLGMHTRIRTSKKSNE